jgi:hemoglobin
MKIVKASIILILLASCLSCSTANTNKSIKTPSLYVKLGQQPALDKIIDNLITIIGNDDVVFDHFADSNITYFRKNLTVFLCHITDGPCEYSGDTMQDIHRGMYINKNQFNHFVELFIDAMEAAEISYPMQNELLARLAPLRESIIKI